MPNGQENWYLSRTHVGTDQDEKQHNKNKIVAGGGGKPFFNGGGGGIELVHQMVSLKLSWKWILLHVE